jgi:hypothetical protein
VIPNNSPLDLTGRIKSWSGLHGGDLSARDREELVLPPTRSPDGWLATAVGVHRQLPVHDVVRAVVVEADPDVPEPIRAEHMPHVPL